MKKIIGFFLGISLSILFGIGARTPVTANAEAGEAISYTDTFIAVLENDKLVEGGEATLVKNSHAYEYGNVVNDKASGFGLVTGASWGAFTSAGNGYITYKITADEGYTLGELDLTFTAAHGHKRLNEFWPKTNVTVSVSADNVTYEKVYDLKKSRGYQDSGFTVYEDIGLELGWFSKGKTTAYIRFDLIHPTFADLTDEHKAMKNIANDETQKIILQMLAVQLREVSVSAKQLSTQAEIPTEYATVVLNFGGEQREITAPVGQKINPAEIASPDGFAREAFELFSDETCETVFDQPVEGNCTLYVKGSWKKYAVSYELNGGENPSENPTEYYSYQGAILKNAYREGYYFVGWYKDEGLTERVDCVSVGTQRDITLYAKWMKAESSAHGNEISESDGCGGSVSVLSGTILLALGATVFAKRKK